MVEQGFLFCLLCFRRFQSLLCRSFDCTFFDYNLKWRQSLWLARWHANQYSNSNNYLIMSHADSYMTRLCAPITVVIQPIPVCLLVQQNCPCWSLQWKMKTWKWDFHPFIRSLIHPAWSLSCQFKLFSLYTALLFVQFCPKSLQWTIQQGYPAKNQREWSMVINYKIKLQVFWKWNGQSSDFSGV